MNRPLRNVFPCGNPRCKETIDNGRIYCSPECRTAAEPGLYVVPREVKTKCVHCKAPVTPSDVGCCAKCSREGAF